jgi:hypothetical protein
MITAVIALSISGYSLYDRYEKVTYRNQCGCEFNYPRNRPTLSAYLNTHMPNRNETVLTENLPAELRELVIARVYRIDEFFFFVLGEYQRDGKLIVNELVCSGNTLPDKLPRLKRLAPEGVTIYHATTMPAENWCCWQHDWFDIRQARSGVD